MGLHLKTDQSRELICDDCRSLLASFDDEDAIRPTDAVLEEIGGDELAESPNTLTESLLENLDPEMTDAGIKIELPCSDCGESTGLVIETAEEE